MKSKRKRRWTKEQTESSVGEKNPCYRSGMYAQSTKKDNSGMRLFFKNRDEYKSDLVKENGVLWCERCGSTNPKLEAHHIVYRSEKPKHPSLHSKENIYLVCVPCHNWLHKSKSNRNELVIKRNLASLFGDDILDK